MKPNDLPIEDLFEDSGTPMLVRDKIDYKFVLNRQIDRTAFVGTAIKTTEFSELPSDSFTRGIKILEALLKPYHDHKYKFFAKELDAKIPETIKDAAEAVIREPTHPDSEYRLNKLLARSNAQMQLEYERLGALSELMARLGFLATESGVDELK